MANFFKKDKSFFIKIFFFCLGVFLLLVRFKYHNEALETDEGSYAYMAQEILRGKIPYVDYFENLPPMIYYIYAFIFHFFGQTSYLIKLSVTANVLISCVFIYMITKKIIKNRFYSFLSSFIYLFTITLPVIQGSMANTEIFMVTFLLISTLLLINSETSDKNILLSGLFMSLALLTKTIAMNNLISSLVYLKVVEKDYKKILLFFLGLIIPLSIVFYLYRGNLAELFFANFIYIQSYLSRLPFPQRVLNFPKEIVFENISFWFLGIISIVYFLFKKNKLIRFIVLNILISFFLVQYTGRRSPHYYIYLLPFISILISLYLFKSYKKTLIKNKFVILVIVISLFYSFYLLSKMLLFIPSNELLSNKFLVYGRGDWYDQSLQAASELKKYFKPDDYIYNLGRESQLYFYTQTRSSSKYYHDRPIEFFPTILKRICYDFTKNKPKAIINTLQPPYFNPIMSKFIWGEISKCQELEIKSKRKISFFEVWFIK